MENDSWLDFLKDIAYVCGTGQASGMVLDVGQDIASWVAGKDMNTGTRQLGEQCLHNVEAYAATSTNDKSSTNGGFHDFRCCQEKKHKKTVCSWSF